MTDQLEIASAEELRRELGRAREHQDALADVLRVMSATPFDLQMVMKTVVDHAVRLCGASTGGVFHVHNGLIRRLAETSVPVDPEALDAWFATARVPVDRTTAVGRVITEGRSIRIADIETDPEYVVVDRPGQNPMRNRSVMAVPLRRTDEVLGVIVLRRREVRPFTDDELALVERFAEHAALAIEHGRLFAETKEALDRQTATTDVLRAISNSPTDLKVVFDAIARSALRFCGAQDVQIRLVEGDEAVRVAHVGDVAINTDLDRIPLGSSMVSTRAIVESRVIAVADLQSSEEFEQAREISRELGFHSALAVPLTREGSAIGMLMLRRREIRPFTEKEIDLVLTFADQAVIAIENVRLFNETKEGLERQTAVAEILRAISASPTDVQPVLDVIAENAARFCSAEDATVLLVRGDQLEPVAHRGSIETALERPGGTRTLPIVRANIGGRAILERRVVQVDDILSMTDEFPWSVQRAREFGWRSAVVAPLMREGEPLGLVLLRRAEVRPFTEKQVDLLKTFADQAVIALENVRLFNETKESLEQQRAIAEILEVISKATTEIQPVFDVVASAAARLTDADGVAIFQADANELRPVAFAPADYRPRHARLGVPVPSNSVPDLAYRGGRTVHVEDARQHPEMPQGEPLTRLAVPIVTSSGVFGVLLVVHLAVRPFTERQIQLLETFARQAAIAIENVRLFNETKEALDQQTATAEILEVISHATEDLTPVFQKVLEKAVAVSAADGASLFLRDGDKFRSAHRVGYTPEEKAQRAAYEKRLMAGVQAGDRSTLTGRVAQERRTVQIPDAAADPEYDFQGFRSLLGVPLLREEEVIGILIVRRREVRPFVDRETRLVEIFAHQAAIAIENVRLFNETKEALEQQTATSDVLKVISHSAFDLRPVLDAVIESAVRLCEAEKGFIVQRDGDGYRWVAGFGEQEAVKAQWGTEPHLPRRESSVTRSALERRTIHISEMQREPDLPDETRRYFEENRVQAHLTVPMLRQGEPVGVITLWKTVPGPFTERQIQLVETFADQAAIAIENVRLFNETKEALESQTAVAEVLKVISGSPTDVQPVLDAIARSASDLCQTDVLVNLIEDGQNVIRAHHGPLEVRLPLPMANDEGSISGHAMRERKTIHVPDLQAEATRYPTSATFLPLVRAVVATPLLREGEPIGAIVLRRAEPVAFTDRQIGLIETFADQAAIAIENVRLFNETKEALDRQTATAEILRAISGSPTDVQPVLDAIAANAVRYCGAEDAALYLVHEGRASAFAHVGPIPNAEIRAHPSERIVIARRDRVLGRAIVDRATIQVPDVHDPTAVAEFPDGLAQAAEFRFRAALATPLVRGKDVIGVIMLRRTTPGRFAAPQIELVETFAAQAVIAIENVRLFNETKEALERQTAVSEILKVMSSSPDSLQPVFDAIAAATTRFCGAEDAAVMLIEGQEARPVAHYGPIALVSAVPVDRDSVTGTAILETRTIQAENLAAMESFPRSRRLDGQRAVLATPLMRSGQAIGAIILRRAQEGAYTPRQVELVEVFADQAVIAIENVRLFNETKGALERQTAVSEVLQSISRTAFDLETVLATVLENAMRLCGSDFAALWRRDGELFRIWVSRTGSEAFDRLAAADPPSIHSGGVTARVYRTKAAVHIHDVLEDPEYSRKEDARVGGYRSLLGVPLMREGEVIAVVALARSVLRDYTPAEIELVRTFADQAAIAIENVRLFNETKEALERQTATAEILKVISGSPTEIQPVLDAIAESAARFCGAEDTVIGLMDGDLFTIRAHSGPVATVPHGTPLARTFVAGHAMIDGRTIQVLDLQAEATQYPVGVAASPTTRTIVAAPLLRTGRPIGTIILRRTEVRAFTERELELLETFAQQAVIAIENVRLFNETKDALAQQTAVADVLKTISRSAFDLQAVLDTLIERAADLCAADSGSILREQTDGGYLIAASTANYDAKLREALRARGRRGPGRESVTGRVLLEGKAVQIEDVVADPEYAAPPEGDPVRTILGVPMVREGHVIGVLVLRRYQVKVFTEREIAIVETFADQAVIAIENVRLFNETKDSLEQQTAVAEILKTISRSAFDLRPVLETLVEQAARLCDAEHGSVHRWDGSAYRTAAFWGPDLTEEYKAQAYSTPRYPGRETLVGRTALTREVVHINDVIADPEYAPRDLQSLGGYRTVLGVPLIREYAVIGVFALMRNRVKPFTERQTELVRTFADQAAIAIENVRLFNETKEALEQQTATSEVLKVISRSAFDLKRVLDTVIASAVKLCSAERGTIWRLDPDRHFRLASYVGGDAEFRAAEATIAIVVDRGTVVGRAALDRKTIHVPDVMSDPSYRPDTRDSAAPHSKKDVPRFDPVPPRALLGVPLLRDQTVLGAISLARTEARAYTEREIELVETFADQAAIAIENVRLFNEIQDKSRQLEVASRHKSEFLANMSHELRTPLNAIIGFTDVMLQEMFGPLNDKQKEYLEDVRGSGNHLLTLINDILDLSKIEAGRVELEVAEFSFPDALEDALTLVRERATRHGIRLATEVAKGVGKVSADERKVKQILVNLLSNAVKFTPDGGWVSVSAKREDGQLQVAVRDTGIGVAPEDQERIFEEFQQVGRDPEKSREGTGLGLTLAKRFVELHGGRMWVESEIGKGSTFTFAIPVRQTAVAEAGARGGKGS